MTTSLNVPTSKLSPCMSDKFAADTSPPICLISWKIANCLMFTDLKERLVKHAVQAQDFRAPADELALRVDRWIHAGGGEPVVPHLMKVPAVDAVPAAVKNVRCYFDAE